MACEEKLARGYRRVAWWLQRNKGLLVNRKRVLRVMRERGLLVRSRRLRARRRKEWGRVEASAPNQIWQSDMTKIWAGPAVGWACLVSVIDCCTREIMGWNLSHRSRTEDALAAVEQAVLARLPEGSREANVMLTTDNGTQFTSSRFLETLGRPDANTSRHSAAARRPAGERRAAKESTSQRARGFWRSGFEELFLAKDHGIDVVGGELESMTMRDRVGGAGFDAVSAKNAARIIDIVDGGVAFGGGDAICFGIFGGLDIDAARGTGCGTQKARYALLEAVLVAVVQVAAEQSVLRRTPDRFAQMYRHQAEVRAAFLRTALPPILILVLALTIGFLFIFGLMAPMFALLDAPSGGGGPGAGGGMFKL